MGGGGDGGEGGGWLFEEGWGRCFCYLSFFSDVFEFAGIRFLVDCFGVFAVWRCQQGCLKVPGLKTVFLFCWLGGIYGGQHWPSPFFAVNFTSLHFTLHINPL